MSRLSCKDAFDAPQTAPSRVCSRFASTIFAEMTALATLHDAVNLGQGFPDTDGPAAMLEVARRAIAEGVNQYPPGPGMPVLASGHRGGSAHPATDSTVIPTPKFWSPSAPPRRSVLRFSDWSNPAKK